MPWRNVIIWFGGHWEGLEYQNGVEEILTLPQGSVQYSDFLDAIHGVVQADMNHWGYVVHSLVDYNGREKRMTIKNDLDLERVLTTSDEPVVFVTLRSINSGRSGPPVLGSQSSGIISPNNEGFLNLLASQNMYSGGVLGRGPPCPQYRMNYNYMSYMSLFANQGGLPDFGQSSSIPNHNIPHTVEHHNSILCMDQPEYSCTPIVNQAVLSSPVANVVGMTRLTSPMVERPTPTSEPIMDIPHHNLYPSSTDGENVVFGLEGGDDDRHLSPHAQRSDVARGDVTQIYENAHVDYDDNSGSAVGVSIDLVDGNDQDIGSDEDSDGMDDVERELFENFCAYISKRGGIFSSKKDHISNRRTHVHTYPNLQTYVTPDSDEGDVGCLRWLIPCLPSESEPPLPKPTSAEFSGQTLCKGAIFSSKEELVMAVGFYHLQNEVEYRVDHSDKTRWSVKCKHKGCQFFMCAYGKYGVWRIVTFVAPHNCEFDASRNAPRQLPSKLIGAVYAPKLLRSTTPLVPRDIMTELKAKHSLTITYTVALRAKQHAIGMIFGDAQQSFRRVPLYLHELELANPGTYCKLKVDDDGKFKYVFFALGASIQGFANHGRPAIVVDGTHLKGKYQGIVFVAVNKDGNEQIFPLATGIGDVENDESWTWFLKRVRKVFGCPPEMLIVSDQHTSISNVVNQVYPDAAHGLCCYHLQNNLAKYGKHVVSMFQNAAYCYRTKEFESYMASLRECGAKGALDNLTRAGDVRWARVKCPVRRYGFMTSNAAETWNGRLVWARKLPLCSVLECARTIIEQWFYERRMKAMDRSNLLSDKAMKRLEKTVQYGSKMQVNNLDLNVFKVVDGSKNFVVDLNNRTCSCRQFQLDLMPCSHAASAISEAKESVYSYVAYYYTTESVKGMWAGSINPVPDPAEWDSPDDVLAKLCEPPEAPRQAGRPKTKRIPSGHTTSSRSGTKGQVCSRCQQPGHNRVRCTTVVPVVVTTCTEDNNTNVQVGADTAHRKKKKCGICKADDHTRRRCPRRTDNVNQGNV